MTKAYDLLATNPEQSRHIKEYKVSYNNSNGASADLFESFLQKAEAEPGYKITWEAFKLFIATRLKNADDLLSWAEQVNNAVEATDLSAQVQAYKDSIKNGHGVIVISHSQGNLFTNRAYTKLDDWMKSYFHNMGVATPAGEVASGGPYVTFDNDPIHYIPGSLDDNLRNYNRYYTHTSATGEQVEGVTGAFHSFDYYLGSTASINDVDISTNEASDKIKAFIVDKIKVHVDAPSQWKKDLTLSENTKNHRITLQHKHDIGILTMDGKEVFPFNEDKKLYYVAGKESEDISGYVMASFGGAKILDADKGDTWENKKEDEAYYLDGTGEVINIYKKPTGNPYLIFDSNNYVNDGTVITATIINYDKYDVYNIESKYGIKILSGIDSNNNIVNNGVFTFMFTCSDIYMTSAMYLRQKSNNYNFYKIFDPYPRELVFAGNSNDVLPTIYVSKKGEKANILVDMPDEGSNLNASVRGPVSRSAPFHVVKLSENKFELNMDYDMNSNVKPNSDLGSISIYYSYHPYKCYGDMAIVYVRTPL